MSNCCMHLVPQSLPIMSSIYDFCAVQAYISSDALNSTAVDEATEAIDTMRETKTMPFLSILGTNRNIHVSWSGHHAPPESLQVTR